MAQPAPVPAARPLAPSDTSRSPGESLIGKARAAVAAATSMVVGLVPRDGLTGRQLLGVALLAVSSALGLVLTLLVARELLGSQERAERRAKERGAREVRENYAASDPLLEDEEKTSGVGNGISTAHASNGAYPAGTFAAARRQRARLRRPVRPQSPARHVRKGLATGAHSPDVRRMLRRRGRDRR
jgi:glutathione S-transferase